MLNWLNKISLKKSVIYFFIFIIFIFLIYKLTPYNIKRTISVEIYDQLPLKYQAITKILVRDYYDIRNLKTEFSIINILQAAMVRGGGGCMGCGGGCARRGG